MNWLNSPVMNVLHQGLDISNLRQSVLSNNIANVDTPEFKRSDVDFSQLLNEAMVLPLALQKTSATHLEGVMPSAPNAIVEDSSTTFRNDGNNVDIDSEMAKVAENNLYYNGLTQAISTQFSLLRTAIGK